MPKVLRIINRFNLGGPAYNVAYLTKYLAPQFDTVLAGGIKDETEESSEFILKDMGLEPIIIPEMRREISVRNDWVAYNKIRKLIEVFKPDIVHTHAAKAGTLGRLAAFHLKVPVVVHTFHGHVFHSYFGKVQTAIYKNIERYLAQKSSAIVAISEKQKQEISGIHKIVPPEKIAVIPLGFDLSGFSENQVEKRKKFREQYRLEEDETAIGIVGRLVPVKNHRLFLEAIKHLKENSFAKFRAFIIGDGESKAQIISIARELNLDLSMGESKSMLTITSWIREIDIAYAGLDIVTLTSFNEGTPVSLIEAQAAGKPVVSTRVGGIENIVIDGQTGLLSGLSEPQRFFYNLKNLLENPGLRVLYGSSGKNNIGRKYHYSRLINEMRDLYLSLLSRTE